MHRMNSRKLVVALCLFGVSLLAGAGDGAKEKSDLSEFVAEYVHPLTLVDGGLSGPGMT